MSTLQRLAKLTTRTGVPSGEITEQEYQKLAIRSTIYRTITIFTIFLGLIMALFNVSGYFVYKIEEYQGDEVQVSLWSLCTVGDDPGDYDCTDGSVGFEFYEAKPEAFFDCFRYFIAAATFFLGLALVFSLATVIITDDTTNRRFWVSAVCHAIAAVLIVCSQSIFALYFQLNYPFMYELRYRGLGWVEMTPYNESYSDGYFVTWGCFGACLLNMILALLMHKHDKDYIALLKTIPPPTEMIPL